MTSGYREKLRAELASLAEQDEYLTRNGEIVSEMMEMIGTMDDESADALMAELGIESDD